MAARPTLASPDAQAALVLAPRHLERIGAVVEAVRASQVPSDTGVLQGMDIAGDHQRQLAHARALGLIAGQKWRIRMCLFQVLQDRERLPEDPTAFFDRRDESLWIDGEVLGAAVLAVVAGAYMFGFLRGEGLCDERLEAAIPTVAHWQLSTLPRHLSEEQLEQVLSSFDVSKPFGQRDRAIVLCLSTLGLRPGEVAGLRLEDIDWRGGTIRLRARKTGRGAVWPRDRRLLARGAPKDGLAACVREAPRIPSW